MTSDQQRRERVASGSKRKRDLEAVPMPGFKKSTRPWPDSKIRDTHSASYFASPEQVTRAKAAMYELRFPFAYNACLNLIALGEKPTKEAIQTEARKIAEANDANFAAQRERRAA